MDATLLAVIAVVLLLCMSSSSGAGAWWFLGKNQSATAGVSYDPGLITAPNFSSNTVVQNPPIAAPSNRDPSRKCRGRGKDVGKPGGVYTWDFDSSDGADLYTCPGNDNWCCKMNADGSVAPGWGRGGGLFAFEKLDSKGCGVETGAQYCNSNPASPPANGSGGNTYGTPQCQWPNDPNLPDAATQNARGEPWYECPDDKTKCCNSKTSTRHPVCGSYPGSSQATCQRPGANPPPPPIGSGGGGGGGTYIVQSGDSLWAIANKHGMSLDALRGLNPGVSDIIMPGQAIKVSGAAAPPINAGGGNFDCGSVAPNRQQGCTPASCFGCPAGFTWTQVSGRGVVCGRVNQQECPSQTDIVAKVDPRPPGPPIQPPVAQKECWVCPKGDFDLPTHANNRGTCSLMRCTAGSSPCFGNPRLCCQDPNPFAAGPGACTTPNAPLCRRMDPEIDWNSGVNKVNVC